MSTSGQAATARRRPAIGHVGVSGITQTAGVVTWTLNKPATGQVEYGTTSAYGMATTPELTYTHTTHVQQVSGLAPGTTYHFRVKSKDSAGTQVVSSDSTFTTLEIGPADW